VSLHNPFKNQVVVRKLLRRKGEVKDVVKEYGHVIADECQHISAFSFEQVLRKVRAKYVTGLTATPYRRDGHQPIIIMQCGPIRHTVKLKARLTNKVLEHHLICRETDFCLPFDQEDSSIQDIYAALILDEKRNQLIFEDILSVLEGGHCPIILTERKDHLEILANELSTFTSNLIILKGGMRTKRRREIMERLAAVPKNEERVLLATGRYIGEGFDDARLDTLFLAMPISWRGTLVQYAGRLHRLHEGKREVRIYDYVDQNVPMLMRMYEKRLKGYRSMGYRLVT
jgi:superfamily II DNA or RNA helicase